MSRTYVSPLLTGRGPAVGSLESALYAVEQRTRLPKPSGRSKAWERMKAHLDRVAGLRRGKLDPEEAAEVEAVTADIKRRPAQRRGEGGGQ